MQGSENFIVGANSQTGKTQMNELGDNSNVVATGSKSSQFIGKNGERVDLPGLPLKNNKTIVTSILGTPAKISEVPTENTNTTINLDSDEIPAPRGTTSELVEEIGRASCRERVYAPV